MKNKILKGIAGLFLLLIVLAQIFPANDINTPLDPQMDLSGDASVPAPVAAALKTSCYDCHSNQPNYPWYANIGVVKYYLTNHIKGSHKKLNFSLWSNYTDNERRHFSEEICEEIEAGKMPIKSYQLMHKDLALSESQKQLICAWAKPDS